MFEKIEDLPIRPVFGTMRGVMEGVALNAERPGMTERITTKPPKSLVHLHRPARISAIWQHVLTLLRSPVEVHRLTDGTVVFNILGSAVLIRNSDGFLTPYLWCLQALDQPYLQITDDTAVVLRHMPWRWIWLERVLGFAMMEYAAELGFLHIKATDQELRAYSDWFKRVIRKSITRHADMARVRRRIAGAFALDPESLRLASFGVPRGKVWSMTTVADYNRAYLLRDYLLQLEQDAPNLSPLYLALCNLIDHHEDAERVQLLKSSLLLNGFKESHWRFISKCNGRLLLPMRYVYRGQDTCGETLDYLRIVCDLGFRKQIPEPLLITLFSVWGNPAQRSGSYAKEYAVHRCYPHIMRLAAARYGSVDFDLLEDELLAIVRWAWDVKLTLTKEQRRQGWSWLLKKARAHLVAVEAKERGQSVNWAVPAQEHTVGPYQLRFLESSYDLWEESQVMRHCIDRYVNDCREERVRIASVTCNQRRVATAMFDWQGDRLDLVEVAGKANRPVSNALRSCLREVHIEGASKRWKEPEFEPPVICRFPPMDEVPVATTERPESQEQTQKEEITMNALITNTGGFIREVEIQPVEAVENTFHIVFKSRLLSAKNPLEYRNNFQLSLDREGLVELKKLIDRSLA